MLVFQIFVIAILVQLMEWVAWTDIGKSDKTIVLLKHRLSPIFWQEIRIFLRFAS